MLFRRAVFTLCLAASATVLAQVRYRPTETGPWRPWHFEAIDSARQSRSATAAEVQAFQGRLQELANIAKRAPAVATPIGFAGELWGSLNRYDSAASQPGRTVPLAGMVSFGAFPLIEFTRNGKVVNEDLKGGETEVIHFIVNELGGHLYGTSRPDGWGAAEIDAFVEPAAGAAVAGLPRYGDVFVVKKNPKPLWLPFPLGEALKPIEAQRRTLFEDRRDNYAKQVAEFTAWKSPAQRAARRADWQKAAKSMPNGGADFIANMEKQDPQIEAAKSAQLAAGGPEEKGVREAERELQEIDAIVKALSPDARNAPSCHDARGGRIADQFRVLSGAPASCRALVRPNRDYFDPKLPRTAPQVLVLDGFKTCLTPQSLKATSPRGGCVINRALIDSMDWDAVRTWLDK